MRIPDRLKPARSGVPFLIGGAAAVFVAVASQALQWSAASTIVVGLALAVLLAAVGPPLALLPAEMAEDRRAAAAAEAELQAALTEARSRQDELYVEQARREECLAAEQARFDERLAEENARFEERLGRERQRSDVQIQRLKNLLTALGTTRSKRRYELLPARVQILGQNYVSQREGPEQVNVRLRLGSAVTPEAAQEAAEPFDWRRLEALVNADDDLPAPRDRVWGAGNPVDPDTIQHVVIPAGGNVFGRVSLSEVLPQAHYKRIRMHLEDQEEVAN